MHDLDPALTALEVVPHMSIYTNDLSAQQEHMTATIIAQHCINEIIIGKSLKTALNYQFLAATGNDLMILNFKSVYRNNVLG